MYLIDTHCHLHDREFFSEDQAAQMLKNAHARGIEQIICIGTSHEDSLHAKAFAGSHDNVFWTYGIHPEFARGETVSSPSASAGYGRGSASATPATAGGRDLRPTERAVDRKRANSALVAIGEVGLDYHYPGYDRQKQIELLEQMLDLAIKLSLPCSFHVRDAFDDFFPVVQNFTGLRPSVLHSFTDNKAHLDYALSHGFYVGINGILVNHSAEFDWVKDLKNNLPLDRIVLETDAPFLTPVPNRGKINEPGNVADVASWLAKKIGVSSDKIAEWTTKNARTIFNLPHPEPNHGADPRA